MLKNNKILLALLKNFKTLKNYNSLAIKNDLNSSRNYRTN
jgi:hypothetical protein